MNQATRELIAKIQGKNFDQIKKIIARTPAPVKDEIIKMVKTKEDYEIFRASDRYAKIRDEQIAAEMYMFLDSLAYSKYTDDPFVERQLTEADFKEFSDFYHKRRLKEVYQNSTIKTLKNKYAPEYNNILNAFNETELDPNELEYLGHSRYLYRGQVLISFEYSPAQVTVEFMN